MANDFIWMANAEAELAEIWLRSPDRNGITEAADQGEAQIRANPGGCGESQDGDSRVMFSGQLVTRWRWDAKKRKATIFQVRSNSGRRQ